MRRRFSAVFILPGSSSARAPPRGRPWGRGCYIPWYSAIFRNIPWCSVIFRHSGFSQRPLINTLKTIYSLWSFLKLLKRPLKDHLKRPLKDHLKVVFNWRNKSTFNATTKKRYSDTTIQRYRNRNLEPEPGTVHNLCKLEYFAPQEIYIIIIYKGGGGRNSMIV